MMTQSATAPTRTLSAVSAAGVSLWLDDLSRDLIQNGGLSEAMTTQSVVGVTSNPTIFAGSLGKSNAYDDQLSLLKAAHATVDDSLWSMMVHDVQLACDALRPIFNRTQGQDGMVSLEVDPRLAHDADRTLAMARHLWKNVGRPNVMIKIPATEAGMVATANALAEGISVNVTLIFGIEQYRRVIAAHTRGLQRAHEAGVNVRAISSVASFFVSRVDTHVDDLLGALQSPTAAGLKGKAALANARVAFDVYQQHLQSQAWKDLAALGAHPQRPLWASTGVKNPSYPADMYVTGLVTKGVVTTVPGKTLEAVAESGKFEGETILSNMAAAHATVAELKGLGIDLDDVATVLEHQGLDKFVASWMELTQSVTASLAAASAAPRVPAQSVGQSPADSSRPVPASAMTAAGSTSESPVSVSPTTPGSSKTEAEAPPTKVSPTVPAVKPASVTEGAAPTPPPAPPTASPKVAAPAEVKTAAATPDVAAAAAPTASSNTPSSVTSVPAPPVVTSAAPVSQPVTIKAGVRIGPMLAPTLKPVVQQLVDQHFASKLAAKDDTLWGAAAQPEASIRLGWVDLPHRSVELIDRIYALRDELLGEGITRIVLCGMGGSSLAPEVIAACEHLRIVILDSTDPDQVSNAVYTGLRRTAVVIASKSGSTVETDSARRAFVTAFEESGINPAQRMIVVTDPGSPLDSSAKADGYRAIFHADPMVGGRYSALSAFGLVPAGLAGADLHTLVRDAASAIPQLSQDGIDNPALMLGATMGAIDGHKTKILLVPTDNSLPGLGDWIEQLVAESTGKNSTGVLPVVVSGLDAPELADRHNDYLPVYFADATSKPALTDPHGVYVNADLGVMFQLWEAATAVAGHLLKINPFDQPDVESAKIAARSMLTATPKVTEPVYRGSGFEVYANTPSGIASCTSVADALSQLFAHLDRKQGYVAVMAYVDRLAHGDLADIRDELASRLSRPVTFGWGPRFLHSTGQFHKGGPKTGVYVVVTTDYPEDLAIPDQAFSFGKLIAAQAAGDTEVLTADNRPVVRIHVTDPDQARQVIMQAIAALPATNAR